jgi:RNA polymerase sigma-70 factor (ECF subfamily)
LNGLTGIAVGSQSVLEATPSTEADLVARVLAGDAGAFDELVHLHGARVFRFLHQFVRQRQDAEDLTQQTFVKAYRHLASFDLARPLIGWLLTIARRSALNHFRSARRWEPITEANADRGPDPAQSAELTEQSRNLWDQARAQLSPREFEVLWLRFGEDFSTAETARVCGLTQPHIKILVYRAKRTLAKGLKT